MTTSAFTRSTVEKFGFEGFESVGSLVANRCLATPRKPGVYVVIRAVESAPRFRTKSLGGWFKDEDPSVPTSVLKARWIPETPVLYIGMAGTDLRDRVDALVKFGVGKPVGHRGGRYLWQVQGSSDFIIAWKATHDARGSEKRLFSEFETAYGQLPFANLQH